MNVNSHSDRVKLKAAQCIPATANPFTFDPDSIHVVSVDIHTIMTDDSDDEAEQLAQVQTAGPQKLSAATVAFNTL